jgi:NAD(P)-dependent dehydrogenase (short-subunit alcohol dehydrogenase family)
MSFLGLAGRTYLVLGVANRKSIAWHVARTLEEQGAKVVYSVRSEARKASLDKLLEGKPTYLCDLEREPEIQALAEAVGRAAHQLVAAARGDLTDEEVRCRGPAELGGGPRAGLRRAAAGGARRRLQ